jgi:hypothetical protein
MIGFFAWIGSSQNECDWKWHLSKFRKYICNSFTHVFLCQMNKIAAFCRRRGHIFAKPVVVYCFTAQMPCLCCEEEAN